MTGYLKSSEEFGKDLSRLVTICKSSFGPNAYLKLIQHEDELELTTSSSKVLEEFETSEPLLQFVLTVAKNFAKCHRDSGLKLTLYVSNWLKQSIRSNIPSLILSAIFDWIAILLQKYLTADNCQLKFTVNIDNMKNLVSFTKNILRSKPASSFKKNELDHVSILVVKAVLNSFPDVDQENNLAFGRLAILSITGSDPAYSQLLPALIIPVNEYVVDENRFSTFIRCKSTQNFKIALCSEPLDETLLGNYVTYYENPTKVTANSFNALVDRLVSNNISVVACQKGINSDLKLFLQRKNVLVLERLGIESLENMKKVSNSRTEEQFSKWPFHIGYVNKMELLMFSGKKYLSMQGKDGVPFQTILLRNLSPETVEENKIVVQKSIDILKNFLWQKNLVPGAGCAESVLICYIRKEVKKRSKTISQSLNCSEHHIFEAVDLFCNGLIQCITPLEIPAFDLTIDDKFGHLFHGLPNFCQCGLVNKKSLKLYQLTTPCLQWDSIDDLKTPSQENLENSIFDNFTHFNSALNIALETSSLLFKIGVCIFQDE